MYWKAYSNSELFSLHNMNLYELVVICRISVNFQRFFNVYWSYILPVVLGLHLHIHYTDIQLKQSYNFPFKTCQILNYIMNVNLNKLTKLNEQNSQRT